MKPEDVPADLVEKGVRAFGMWSKRRDLYDQPTRRILAAVLPEVRAQAQQDLIADLLARNLWPVRHDLNEYPIEAVPKSVLLEYRNRIARLSTAKEPT